MKTKINLKRLVKVVGTLITISGLCIAYSKMKNKEKITEIILTKIEEEL